MACPIERTPKSIEQRIASGEGIDLIHAVEPAGIILERVVGEAEAALARRFA